MIWFASKISLIDKGFKSGNVTSSITTKKKHPTLDIWWFIYDDIYPHLGDEGRVMADMLVGKTPDGQPNMSELIFEMVEIEDLVAEGWVISGAPNYNE